MKRVIGIATATIMTLLVGSTLSVAAQDFNKQDRTLLTFSSGVELPDMRLEPGTYVFRIGDNPSRNIVQVLTEDGNKILGQWFFIPAERQQVTGETVVTFRETSAGSTPAVQYWYYPGESIGKEFIYPKDQAMRIAQRTGATVLTADGRVTASDQAQASIQTDTQPISAPAEVAVVPQTQAEVVVPQTEVGTAGGADQAPAATGTGSVRQEATNAQNELPRTASPLPLSGLIALLLLAGAAGIRAFRLQTDR